MKQLCILMLCVILTGCTTQAVTSINVGMDYSIAKEGLIKAGASEKESRVDPPKAGKSVSMWEVGDGQIYMIQVNDESGCIEMLRHLQKVDPDLPGNFVEVDSINLVD